MFTRLSTLAFALMVASASAKSFVGKKDAKANLVDNLMRGARPTKNNQLFRRLNDQEEYQVDISKYSIKYKQCQFVKEYDDELAEDEEYDTVLATKHFVVFRLCPYCDSCSSGYGEYIIDMETYLESTLKYRQEEMENMCKACEENCYYQAAAENADEAEADNADAEEADNADGGRRKLYTLDCDTCANTCDKIENMENNGYVDAANYVECQKIQDAGDDGIALYASAVCASNGSKIKIGVFTDENCMIPDNDKNVEDYLADNDGNQMKISPIYLKTVYDEDDCISCLQQDENQDANQDNNQDNNDQEPEVTEVCQQLYEGAAKCEKIHGFDDGYANYEGYDNQLANEQLVCDFISAIKAGTYSQEGEIVVGGGTVYNAGGSTTSGSQKFALAFFILGTVGLAVYAAMLHTQLTKSAKANLSSQGGAMA